MLARKLLPFPGKRNFVIPAQLGWIISMNLWMLCVAQSLHLKEALNGYLVPSAQLNNGCAGSKYVIF